MGLEKSKIEQHDKYTHITNASFYHFGKVDVYQDDASGVKFFKQKYEFILEPELQEEYIRKLQEHNNQCGNMVQIKSIKIDNTEICSMLQGAIDIYFEYLPVSLANIIEKQKESQKIGLSESQGKFLLTKYGEF